MNIASLPKFPIRYRPRVPRVLSCGLGLPPRVARTFLDLALIAACVVLVYVLHQTSAAVVKASAPRPKPVPLDFRLVEQRYWQISHDMDRGTVLRLLGPPTDWALTFPEVEERGSAWLRRHDDNPDLGNDQIWYRWDDPADPRKWVLVFFADGKVHGDRHGGFKRP